MGSAVETLECKVVVSEISLILERAEKASLSVKRERADRSLLSVFSIDLLLSHGRSMLNCGVLEAGVELDSGMGSGGHASSGSDNFVDEILIVVYFLLGNKEYIVNINIIKPTEPFYLASWQGQQFFYLLLILRKTVRFLFLF